MQWFQDATTGHKYFSIAITIEFGHDYPLLGVNMTQRIKAGNFYLDVPTAGTSLDNHPGSAKPLTAEKSDTPEPLEVKQYIFRPNDPFQSSIDRIEAAGNLSTTHKPWVKTAWLYVFVICPLIFMELFALTAKFAANGGWKGYVIVHFFMAVYGVLSYSIWLNKAKGPSDKVR
jgi:hypothetical protein